MEELERREKKKKHPKCRKSGAHARRYSLVQGKAACGDSSQTLGIPRVQDNIQRKRGYKRSRTGCVITTISMSRQG